MVENFVNHVVIPALPIYKYGLLFLVVMIEGPFVSMLAGLFVAQHLLNPYFAYIVILCGDIASDSIYFGIGWWKGEKAANRYLQYVRWRPERIERAKQILKKHPAKTLIIGKLTHFAGVPMLMAAGSVKIPFRAFFIYDLIATIPKSLTFVLIGYYVGSFTKTINNILEYGTVSFLSLLVIILLYSFLAGYIEKRFLKKDN